MNKLKAIQFVAKVSNLIEAEIEFRLNNDKVRTSQRNTKNIRSKQLIDFLIKEIPEEYQTLTEELLQIIKRP